MKFRSTVSTLSLGLLLAVIVPSVAYAHVVVSPKEAVVGARTTFSMSVPNEKDVAVTELKLTIPAGLKEVQPTVHPGWTITSTADSIIWSGGTIPAGQRDDFTFRTQAPATATSLIWKAYQTYADGTTVAWDQKPTENKASAESESNGPYSVTNIINDLGTSKPTAAKTEDNSDLVSLGVSLIALTLSVIAITRRHTK